MTTNTAGHLLIGDGTNYNPTALSGDVTVNGSGVTAIGAVITTSQIAAGTLVLDSEGIASNDNNTTLPTSAAVKDYVDTQIGSGDTIAELNDTDIGSLSGVMSLFMMAQTVGTIRHYLAMLQLLQVELLL